MAERELQSAKITLTIDDAQLRESMRRMRDEARETKATKGSDRTAGSTVDVSKMSRSQFDLLKVNQGAEPGVEVVRKGTKKKDDKKAEKEAARRVAAEEKRVAGVKRKRDRDALGMLLRFTRIGAMVHILDRVTAHSQAAGVGGPSGFVANAIQGAKISGQRMAAGVGALSSADADLKRLAGAFSGDSTQRIEEIDVASFLDKRQADIEMQANLKILSEKTESLAVDKARQDLLVSPNAQTGYAEWLAGRAEDAKDYGMKTATSGLKQLANWLGYTNPAGGQWR